MGRYEIGRRGICSAVGRHCSDGIPLWVVGARRGAGGTGRWGMGQQATRHWVAESVGTDVAIIIVCSIIPATSEQCSGGTSASVASTTRHRAAGDDSQSDSVGEVESCLRSAEDASQSVASDVGTRSGMGRYEMGRRGICSAVGRHYSDGIPLWVVGARCGTGQQEIGRSGIIDSCANSNLIHDISGDAIIGRSSIISAADKYCTYGIFHRQSARDANQSVVSDVGTRLGMVQRESRHSRVIAAASDRTATVSTYCYCT
jgi:hypothetical protein